MNVSFKKKVSLRQKNGNLIHFFLRFFTESGNFCGLCFFIRWLENHLFITWMLSKKFHEILKNGVKWNIMVRRTHFNYRIFNRIDAVSFRVRLAWFRRIRRRGLASPRRKQLRLRENATNRFRRIVCRRNINDGWLNSCIQRAKAFGATPGVIDAAWSGLGQVVAGADFFGRRTGAGNGLLVRGAPVLHFFLQFSDKRRRLLWRRQRSGLVFFLCVGVFPVGKTLAEIMKVITERRNTINHGAAGIFVRLGRGSYMRRRIKGAENFPWRRNRAFVWKGRAIITSIKTKCPWTKKLPTEWEWNLRGGGMGPFSENYKNNSFLLSFSTALKHSSNCEKNYDHFLLKCSAANISRLRSRIHLDSTKLN